MVISFITRFPCMSTLGSKQPSAARYRCGPHHMHSRPKGDIHRWVSAAGLFRHSCHSNVVQHFQKTYDDTADKAATACVFSKALCLTELCRQLDLKGATYLLADYGYDANSLRKHLRQPAVVPFIPSGSNRRRSIGYGERCYMDRQLIENAFYRLKDFRRIATRYDKLARSFLSAVTLAILIVFWI